MEKKRDIHSVAIFVATLSALLCIAPSHAARPSGQLRAIDVRDQGQVTTITLRGSQTPTFTVYKLRRPDRLVVDLANTVAVQDAPGTSGTRSINSWSVGQVSAQAIGDRETTLTRIIVRFARPSTYTVKAVGNDLRVTVRARQSAPANVLRNVKAKLRRAELAARAAEKRKDHAQTAAKSAAQRRALAEAAAKSATQNAAQAERQRAAAEAATRTLAQKQQVEQKRLKALIDARKAEEIRSKKAARQRAQVEQQRLKALIDARKAEEVRAKKAVRERAAVEQQLRQLIAESEAEQARSRARAQQRSQEQGRLARLTAARKEEEVRARRLASVRSKEQKRLGQLVAARKKEEARSRSLRVEQSQEEKRLSALVAKREAAESRSRTLVAESSQEEKRLLALVAARKKEETRSQQVMRQRAQEEKRLKALVAARTREEAIMARTEAANRELEAKQVLAQRASVEQAHAERAARRARAKADERREASLVAARQAKRVKQQKDASRQQVADANAKAQQTRKQSNQARRALAQRQRELAVIGGRLRATEAAQQKAQRASESSQRALRAASARRENEEKLIAEVQLRRLSEEKKLRAAKQARARQEARLLALESSIQQAQQRHAQEQARVRPKAQRSRPRVAAPTRRRRPVVRGTSRVRDVDYVDLPHTSRVLIALTGNAKPRVVAASARKAILEIEDTRIASNLERTLDTSDFSGPIRMISSFRDPRRPGRVRVVVDLKSPVRGQLRRVGNEWHWDFAKKQAKRSRRRRPRSRSFSPPVVGAYGAASTPVTSQTVARRRRKVYRGKRIDLNFKDADIHNLLRVLAEVGGVNLVVPDNVKASVTVRLNNVPWDQALEVILESKGFWYKREGNLIRIATRDALDKEDEAQAARLRARVQSESPEPDVFTLNYANADDLAKQVGSLLSPKGKIQVDKRTNSLIINDIRAHRERIIQLLRRLDTQTPQIQIEARIVEARSTFSREVGIQWGGSGISSAATGNPTGLIFPSTVGAAGGATDTQTPTGGVANPDFGVNLPATVGTGAGGAVGFNFGSISQNFNLTLRLSAAEDTGSVRIVSAPKITVLNNVEATIKQGVSIPISVVSAQGVQTQFVQADLELVTTPHVSQRDCSILLKIDVKKNEADFVNTGARGDPTILRKEASTTMLIADGETAVIGGIYTRNSGLGYKKVPYLADIPIFGALFRSRSENDERTEVLIFITPRITNKASLRCETASASR